MRTVQFDAVEADLLGECRRLGERGDDCGQAVVVESDAERLAAEAEPRGTHRLQVGLELRGQAAVDADVPELGDHRRALGMDGFDDVAPASGALSTVEARHAGERAGCRAAHVRRLADDQPDPARSPHAVVLDVLGGRHTVGRLDPGHRRHREPVAEVQ